MKMKSYKAILAGAALLAVPALCSAGLVYSNSFETGTFDGWWAGSINSSTTTVSTVRASDGIYSAGLMFNVSSNMAGWGEHAIVWGDTRSFVDANTTELSVDVYSDWANPQGWGVYGNSIQLILNYEGGYTSVAPTSGALANGSFQTFTYDLTPYAATISDAGLGYSTLGFAWFLGTWADNGMDNGTQTLAVDNIHVIPEPATIGMIAFAGAGLLFARRRFMM
jgi:hypothetical protein